MRRAFWPLVVLLALIGFTARVWNLDYDQRAHLHPDERFWAMTSDAMGHAPAPAAHGTVIGPVLDWLDGDRTAASPYRVTPTFLYGPVTLALARSASTWLLQGVVDGDQPAHAVARALDAIGIPLIDDAGRARFDAGYGVDLVGRLMGAIFDTCTIVVIALIGRRLGGRAAGVAAAALYAGSVIAIQHTHFLGSEPLLGLTAALTVLGALRLDRGADRARAVSSGLLVGIAGGATVAVKLTGGGLVAVVALGCVLLAVRHRRQSDVLRLVALLLGAGAAFRFFDPSAFRGLGLGLSRSFSDDLRRARELTEATTPPTFQFANRIPAIQPLVWLGLFCVGPGVALAAGFGAFAVAAQVWTRRLGRTASSLMTDVGRWPLFVVAACTAGPFAFIVATSFPTARYFFPMFPALYALGGLGIAAAIRWAMRSTGRVRAGAWALAGASLVLAVVWAIGFVAGVYGATNTRIAASHWIAANVPAGSVLSSEAWDDGLPLPLPGIDTRDFGGERLDLVSPDDEAKVARVAEQLVGVDYVVESSPRIWNTVVRMPARFPSTINFFDGLDSGALGFDRVATFTGGIGIGPWHLDESAAEEAFSVYDHPEVRIWHKARALTRDEIVAVLDPVAAANAVPIDPRHASANGLVLTNAEIATNATGPTYDEAFDTGGSAVLHALGWFLLLELLGAALFVLCCPMLLRLPDAGLGVAKILGLAAIATMLFVAAAWLHVDLDRTVAAVACAAPVVAAAAVARRRTPLLRRLWSERRVTLVTVELLGVAVFVAMLLLRAADPDLWHPYRGGEKPMELALLTAVLRTKTLPVYDPWYSHGTLNYYYGGWLLLSGPARVLRTAPALVMNLALAVVGTCAAGAAYCVGGGLVNAARRRWRRGSRTDRATRRAGLLAAAFVLMIGSGAVLGPFWRSVTGSLGAGERIDWWALSRVIPNSVTVTEFPAWSFLFGDVHPHLMGIPVLLGVGALAIAWYTALTDGRRAHAVVLAAMLGIGVGLTRLTNTWDFPLAIGLSAGTLLFALASRTPWRRLIAPAVVLAVSAVLVWAPYVSRGEVFDSGFDAATLRTPPSSWLEQFGWFEAVTVLLLMVHLGVAFRASRPVWRWITTAHLAVVVASLTALAYFAARPRFEVFLITAASCGACVWCAWRSWTARRWRRPDGRPLQPRGNPIGPILLAVGWAIQAGVEMFTVRNDGGRMNTVFKFWYESWIVLAVGAAVVVAESLHARDGWVRRSYRALAAVAVVLGLAFWWIATPVRVDDRVSAGGLSLDGEAYLSPSFVVGSGDDRVVPSDDVALIDWLRANVRGVQVVAEAPGIDYTWTTRVTWSTGLPTPIGWVYHESQQRRPYGASIDARKRDMTTLYSTTDPAEMARVLARYSVAYLVFGTQEQLLASPASEEALRSFECLDIVVRSDRSTPDGIEAGGFFVAHVDAACVIRLQPPLPPPPPSP